MKKILSFIMVASLVVLCLCLTSCDKAEDNANLWADALYTEDTELGNGEKTVIVEVAAEDKSVTFTIKTDKETVGAALEEHNLVSGEKGPYGLYVKVVNGITADYDANQSDWSFNKDGEYMQTGVDVTEFSDGDHYELVYTK